jgi:hypothetical protein
MSLTDHDLRRMDDCFPAPDKTLLETPMLPTLFTVN